MSIYHRADGSESNASIVLRILRVLNPPATNFDRWVLCRMSDQEIDVAAARVGLKRGEEDENDRHYQVRNGRTLCGATPPNFNIWMEPLIILAGPHGTPIAAVASVSCQACLDAANQLRTEWSRATSAAYLAMKELLERRAEDVADLAHARRIFDSTT